MKPTLVAIGCSHTAGSELYNEISEHPKNRDLAYSKKIADKLGMDYINIAVNGGSNDYIFRSTIEFVNNNIRNIQNYRFLIGWTSSLRIELRYHDDDKYSYFKDTDHLSFYDNKYIPITSGMDYDLIDDKSIRSIVKKYKVDLLENTLCADKFANYAFSLQSILELHKIKYFMYNTIHGQVPTKNNKNTIKQLSRNPRYYNPNDHEDTFFFLCRDKLGFTDITKYWHHKQPAHDAWAEILHERCKLWLS